MPLNTLKDLLVRQLRELQAAEMHSADLLPRLAKAASNPALSDALHRHAAETKEHITRLHNVLQALNGCIADMVNYHNLLDDFKFKPAPATGRNAGAIYVTSLTDHSDDGEALYLGKIANGKFEAVRSCPAGIAERIVAAASDPKAAAIAYGKRTGSCCICARELTDPQSVEAGIGPICAEKYAF
jgi:hypothetical protein